MEAGKLVLYIPDGVKSEQEIFNGFGKREFLQSVVGFLFGCCIAVAVCIASGSVAATVVAVLSGIFGSFMMCTKDQNNMSVTDQVMDLVRFSRSQQIYPYRVMDEWGMR